MALILCDKVIRDKIGRIVKVFPHMCKNCNERFVKDPLCSGDYYHTEQGTVLMKFCPGCGAMLPYISTENDFGIISNNSKKRIAVRVANEYNRGYKEIKEIACKNLGHIDDRRSFIETFAKEIGIPADQISNLF